MLATAQYSWLSSKFAGIVLSMHTALVKLSISLQHNGDLRGCALLAFVALLAFFIPRIHFLVLLYLLLHFIESHI
jgi:hypothetical protein